MAQTLFIKHHKKSRSSFYYCIVFFTPLKSPTEESPIAIPRSTRYQIFNPTNSGIPAPLAHILKQIPIPIAIIGMKLLGNTGKLFLIASTNPIVKAIIIAKLISKIINY